MPFKVPWFAESVLKNTNVSYQHASHWSIVNTHTHTNTHTRTHTHRDTNTCVLVQHYD